MSMWQLRADCAVDLDRQVVHTGGDAIRLTARECALLAYLIEREGADVSVEELHREVWGHGPDVLSRAAHNTVYRLKRKLERVPSRPEHLLTIHNVGFRLVRAEEARAARHAGPAEPLFGRRAQLSRALALLTEHRIVTLSGLGGIGKTRLARAILEERAGQFVDLAGVRDDSGVLRAIASALGATLGSDPVAQLAWALASAGPQLVVLDNAEQVAGPVAALLSSWTALAPDTAWLVTSRVRLSLEGEVLLPLAPLEVPPAGATDDELRDNPAVGLFLARATGPTGELRAVAELARRLEGIPLALELAAARTSVLDAAALVDRLDRPLAVLRRPGRDRQDAVARSLGLSWALLDDDERATLAQCSVFRTPFTVEAAEAVVLLPGDAFFLDALQGLVDASLLWREGPRLRMFAVVRDFASAVAPPDAETALRHARTLARHGAPEVDVTGRDPDFEARIRARDAELEDLLAAAEVACAAPEAATALELARALTASMVTRGPLLGARRWVEAALALDGDAPELAERRVALRVAWATSLARAGAWTELALVLEAAQADGPGPGPRVELAVLQTTGALAVGRVDDAQRAWEAGMELVGDRPALHAQLLNLGAHLAFGRGDLEQARAMLHRALDLTEGLDPLQRAAHCAMGVVLGALGQGRVALDHMEAGVALARKGIDRHVLADALEGLGRMRAEAGLLDEAEEAFAEASTLLSRLGHARPRLLGQRGELALDTGDAHLALVLGQEAQRAARHSDEPVVLAESTALEGRALLATGDAAGGRAVLERALELLPSGAQRVRAQIAAHLAAHTPS